LLDIIQSKTDNLVVLGLLKKVKKKSMERPLNNINKNIHRHRLKLTAPLNNISGAIIIFIAPRENYLSWFKFILGLKIFKPVWF